MKKALLIFVLIFVMLSALTSCISTKSTALPVQMKEDATSHGKEVIGQMHHKFKIYYNLFGKQKPSDETMLERIDSLTQKKYGPDAQAVDISFVRQVEETIDILEYLTESEGFSDTDIYVIANWNVVKK